MIKKMLLSIHFLFCFSLLLASLSYAETKVTYHANGAKHIVVTKNDKGMIVGNSYSYYDNGQVNVIIPHQNGSIHGTRKEFLQSGKISKECDYVGGFLEGTCVSYYKDGSVSFKGQYKNNVAHGLHLSYYPGGKLQAQTSGEWKEGFMHGKFKEFYSDGQIFKDENWENNLKEGTWSHFYPNGMHSRITIWEKGKTEGIEKTFFPSGMLQQEISWANHKFYGDFKEYYDADPGQESQLYKVTPYIKNIIKGTIRQYYKNGVMSVEENHDGTKILGSVTVLHENGQKASITDYKSGIMIMQTKFYQDGRLATTIQYNKAGQQHGKETHYYKNAQLSYERNWNNGVPDDDYDSYDEQGYLIEKEEK